MPTTPRRHLGAAESFSSSRWDEMLTNGVEAAHRNKLYNILFVSPAWLLVLLFFTSWQLRAAEAQPRSAAPSHGSSAAIWARCALPRKAQSGDTALPGAINAEEQSPALPSEQGGRAGLLTTAPLPSPGGKSCQLPPGPVPAAPVGASCLLAHEGQTAPVVPRPSLTGHQNCSSKD